MEKTPVEINNENVFRAMLKLGVPAVLTALFDEINGVIDTIFMGHYIGNEAVAAMSVVMPFLVLASALALLFGDGAAISMGRYLGAKNYAKSSEIASQTIKTTIAASVVLGVLSFFIAPTLLGFFGLEEQTLIYAVKYIRYFSLGLPIFMYAMLILKFLYTEGFSKITLRLTILQVVLNIGLNSVFLILFKWGIEGAVAGTLVSFLIQCIVSTRFLIKKNARTKIKNIKLNKKYFSEVIPLGLPAFFTMILLAVTMTVQSKVIAGYGSSALGVETIFGNVFSVSSSVATGIMNAALVLMSYSVGAKNIKRFIEIIKKSAVVVFSASILISIPLIFAPNAIGSLFTTSSEIIEMFVIPSIMLGITSPFIFTTNTVLFAMQPIGMEKTATVIFALQQLVLYLPLIAILKDISYVHAMAAQPSAEVIGGIITLCLIPAFIKKMQKCFGSSLQN